MMELCIARGTKQNLRIFSHRVNGLHLQGLWGFGCTQCSTVSTFIWSDQR